MIGGPRHDLALGAAVCADLEPAVAAGTAASESVLAGRRDLSSRGGELGVPSPPFAKFATKLPNLIAHG
jgi:hypothetical protein